MANFCQYVTRVEGRYQLPRPFPQLFRRGQSFQLAKLRTIQVLHDNNKLVARFVLNHFLEPDYVRVSYPLQGLQFAGLGTLRLITHGGLVYHFQSQFFFVVFRLCLLDCAGGAATSHLPDLFLIHEVTRTR